MINRLFLLSLTVFFCIIHSAIASAGWQAIIHAEGEDLGGQYKGDVTIGVDSESITKSAAPLPPQYSCAMVIPSSDWTSNLATDIRQEGETDYRWIIAINPSGNIGPPSERTSTISWDPSAFDCGSFYQLKEGHDGTGQVVVPDMKTTTEYQISGGNSDQYLTLTASVADEPLIGRIVSPDSDMIIYEGGSVNFQGAVASCDSTTYLWDFSDSGVESSDEEYPGDVTFPVAGVYEVTFTVTDDGKNADNVSVTVTVEIDPGDIDANQKIEVTDAILALKILAGMDISDAIHLSADINNDNQIGMAEVICILRILSGL